MEEMTVKKRTLEGKKCYTIKFEHRPNYLYAYIEGDEDSVEISKEYWSKILEKCQENNHGKVLIEENLSENLSASETYQFAKELPNLGFGHILIALFDRQPEHYELNRFRELVANNRGLNSKVFNTINEAENWLLES